MQAKPLNGAQRLKLMHDMFNMDGASKFHFDWKDLVKSGLSVKDAIAPTAFAFKNSRTFQMGGIFCAASFLSITASDISDQLLKDFLDMDSSQIVTMHIQSVDQNKAIKTVKTHHYGGWTAARSRSRKKPSVPGMILTSFRRIWRPTVGMQRHF